MPDRRRQLVIVGAGGHGRELLDLVEAVNAAGDHDTYRFLGFIDDGQVDLNLLARRGTGLLGGLDLLGRLETEYLIGVGAAVTRARIDRYASVCGRRPATLVHPRASLGGDVKLGPGTVICAFASLTTNVETGRHVLVNIGASVAHDCRLGNYATLAPGARIGGNVEVGPGAWVGAQASVVRRRRIGAGAVVGAGSVVTDDVRPDLVVAGVPARPIDPTKNGADAPHPATPQPPPPPARIPAPATTHASGPAPTSGSMPAPAAASTQAPAAPTAPASTPSSGPAHGHAPTSMRAADSASAPAPARPPIAVPRPPEPGSRPAAHRGGPADIGSRDAPPPRD